MQPDRNSRRSYGTGSLYVHRDGNGRETWYARWRVARLRRNNLSKTHMTSRHLKPHDKAKPN
jgi:hypothetical protein